MIDELDLVVLKRDLPDARLAVGDVGTVMLVHRQGAGDCSRPRSELTLVELL